MVKRCNAILLMATILCLINILLCVWLTYTQSRGVEPAAKYFTPGSKEFITGYKLDLPKEINQVQTTMKGRANTPDTLLVLRDTMENIIYFYFLNKRTKHGNQQKIQ